METELSTDAAAPMTDERPEAEIIAESADLNDENPTDETEAQAPPQTDFAESAPAADEWKERYIRLQADFDNFRKRTLKESELIRLSAQEDILKKILPLADDMERGIKVAEQTEEIESLREGLKLVLKNLYVSLEKIGVETIPAKGELFDSELHEAIVGIPVDDENDKNRITEEIRKGYRFRDKVLRYSQVVVGQ